MRFTRTFFRGLIVLVPLALTAYLLVLAVIFIEAAFAGIIRLFVPDEWYYPGMGIAVAVVTIFLFGLLLQAWLVRQVIRMAERSLERVPIVKSVYIAISDLLAYFRKSGREHTSQVVLVTIGHSQLLGLMTRDDVRELPLGPARRRVAVYIPMSYQLGGFTIFVPRSTLKPLDMSFEDAMRFIITAGAGTNEPLIEAELSDLEHELAVKKHRDERDERDAAESALGPVNRGEPRRATEGEDDVDVGAGADDERGDAKKA